MRRAWRIFKQDCIHATRRVYACRVTTFDEHAGLARKLGLAMSEVSHSFVFDSAGPVEPKAHVIAVAVLVGIALDVKGHILAVPLDRSHVGWELNGAEATRLSTARDDLEKRMRFDGRRGS